MAAYLASLNLSPVAFRALIESMIMERAEIAYEYSMNPPTLVEWEAYVEYQRIKVELFVLESFLNG